MKRVVITGATGTVGAALVKELLSEGATVTALIRKREREAVLPRHPRLTVWECPLSDLAHFTPPCTDMEVFYHLAWAGTSGNGRGDTLLQCENIHASLAAVDLAARFGCHTFIGIGSQAELGRVAGPLHQSTPPFPTTPYGIAKLAASGLTRLRAESHGMRHIWVRILSVFGPNDRENSLISYTIRTLLQGKSPQYTPAKQMWDLLYCKDAARALRLLGERGKHGKSYLLGSGRARPLRDHLAEARDLLAPHVSLQFGALPYPADQVMHLEADISDLTRDTGFLPTTPFAEAILETASWWKSRLK